MKIVVICSFLVDVSVRSSILTMTVEKRKRKKKKEKRTKKKKKKTNKKNKEHGRHRWNVVETPLGWLRIQAVYLTRLQGGNF